MRSPSRRTSPETDVAVTLRQQNGQFIAEKERVALNARIVQRMVAVRAEGSPIENVLVAFPQRIRLCQICLIVRRCGNRGAAAVDFHVAAAAEKEHPVDGKFHIGIIPDVPVRNDRFRKCGLEQVTCRFQLRKFAVLPPVRIPGPFGIAENMDKIGILERLIGGAFDAEPEIAFPGFRILVQFPEHLAFAPHQPGERNRMPMCRIAARIGGQTELIEKDGVDAELHRKVDVPFEPFNP